MWLHFTSLHVIFTLAFVTLTRNEILLNSLYFSCSKEEISCMSYCGKHFEYSTANNATNNAVTAAPAAATTTTNITTTKTLCH
jgi:hypothetical protein